MLGCYWLCSQDLQRHYQKWPKVIPYGSSHPNIKHGVWLLSVLETLWDDMVPYVWIADEYIIMLFCNVWCTQQPPNSMVHLWQPEPSHHVFSLCTSGFNIRSLWLLHVLDNCTIKTTCKPHILTSFELHKLLALLSNVSVNDLYWMLFTDSSTFKRLSFYRFMPFGACFRHGNIFHTESFTVIIVGLHVGQVMSKSDLVPWGLNFNLFVFLPVIYLTINQIDILIVIYRGFIFQSKFSDLTLFSSFIDTNVLLGHNDSVFLNHFIHSWLCNLHYWYCCLFQNTMGIVFFNILLMIDKNTDVIFYSVIKKGFQTKETVTCKLTFGIAGAQNFACAS